MEKWVKTNGKSGWSIVYIVGFQVIISPKDIKDIYFFQVNTKYISSSVLKTTKFSRVRSTSEN